MTDRDIHLLLDRLEIDAGMVLYVHSSFSRLRFLQTTPERLISVLIGRLGPSGTLVLPSFAWNLYAEERPWSGYLRYFTERPVFDVRRTPANIGALPEAFRTFPGTLRSAHCCWSICAIGALAERVTARQATVLHPYGPDSSFGLLAVSRCVIVGLGVTLNTTSLTPVIDYLLGTVHTQRVFTDRPQPCTVVDADGGRIEASSYWLLPDVVRLIRPSVLFELSERLASSTCRADQNGTILFSYPFDVYQQEALMMGRAAIALGQKVPWLANLPLRTDGPVA